MSRKVICLLNNATVEATNCDPSLTVFSSESCNNHACSEGNTINMTIFLYFFFFFLLIFFFMCVLIILNVLPILDHVVCLLS